MVKYAQERTEFLSGVVIAFLIILFLTIISIAIYFGRWNGAHNVNCNDFDPCTNNLILPDGTCIFRPFQNGTFCSHGDVCYNTSALSFCFNGVCTSDRTFCRGFCNVDADCPELPFSSRLGPIIPEINCIQHSCIYTIVGGITAECLSWIDFDPTNPVVAEGCLIFRFTDEGFTFPPGICFIRYECAPFDFSMKKRELQQQDDYNDAIMFFKNNSLLFDDMANLNGNGLIHLKQEFQDLMNRTKFNYQSIINQGYNPQSKSKIHKKKPIINKH